MPEECWCKCNNEGSCASFTCHIISKGQTRLLPVWSYCFTQKENSTMGRHRLSSSSFFQSVSLSWKEVSCVHGEVKIADVFYLDFYCIFSCKQIYYIQCCNSFFCKLRRKHIIFSFTRKYNIKYSYVVKVINPRFQFLRDFLIGVKLRHHW